jgi:hypothetical protein
MRLRGQMVLNTAVAGKSFPPVRNFGACDVCGARGTTHRCAANCDFDLCPACRAAWRPHGVWAPRTWVRARPGRLSALSVSHSKSVL